MEDRLKNRFSINLILKSEKAATLLSSARAAAEKQRSATLFRDFMRCTMNNDRKIDLKQRYTKLDKKDLNILQKDNCSFDKTILKKALKIGTPVALEQVAMCSAMVVSTMIVAPLGNVSIAAHSFAITAESLCYMPGYGMAAAATTLVGQQLGAKNYKLAKKYGNISLVLGTSLMTLMAILMFILCPIVFRFLTPVLEVRSLAITILRIGLIAEPLYAVSIVTSGALRGAEDTLVPSIMNLVSIWVVRIGLSILLVGKMGLVGVWIAMAVELSVRGILLLIRQLTSKYYEKR